MPSRIYRALSNIDCGIHTQVANLCGASATSVLVLDETVSCCPKTSITFGKPVSLWSEAEIDSFVPSHLSGIRLALE